MKVTTIAQSNKNSTTVHSTQMNKEKYEIKLNGNIKTNVKTLVLLKHRE